MLAGEKIEREAGEEFEGDVGGGGVAGEAEEGRSAAVAEDYGGTGLDECAIEVESCAQGGQGLFDVVEFSGRDAAGEEEEVRLEALFDEGTRLSGVVGGDGEQVGDAGGALDLSGQGMGVRVADLLGEWGTVEGHEFIAGGQDGHGGAAKDGDPRVAAGGKEGDMAGIEAGARWDERLALVCFFGAAGDEGSGGNRGVGNVVGRAEGVFDHQDGIGTLRDGSTGHNFVGLAREESTGGIAGADGGGDGEGAGEVRGADGVAIADRAIKRGDIAISSEREREDAVECLGKWNGFGGGVREDFAEYGGAGVRKAECHDLECHDLE